MVPDGSGLELLREIKSDSRLSHLPVAISSSRTDRKSLDEARQLGAFAYIYKPVHMEDLLRVLAFCTEDAPEGEMEVVGQ